MMTTIDNARTLLEHFPFPNVFEFHQRIERGTSTLIVTPFRPDGESDAYVQVTLDGEHTYVEESFTSDASFVMNTIDRGNTTRDMTVWRNVDRARDAKQLAQIIHAEVHVMHLEQPEKE